MKALLIGRQPAAPLGHTYVSEPPYDGVVIGSLTISQALYFRNEQALTLLAEGKKVVCYEPGFPRSPKNRALGAQLSSARRNLKNLGIVFTDGGQKRLITAQEARILKEQGHRPAPGAVLTPLAKEIMGELD